MVRVDTYEDPRLAQPLVAKSIYIAFTMDCERIAHKSPPGGPDSWELSEKAIKGFCRTLMEKEILPTLFLTPECGARHAELLRQLGSSGVDLGLHIHPQSLGDGSYTKYLGEYSMARQAEIVRSGCRALARALGLQPRSFRPGNFSASRDTFTLLSELGFRQGSVSDPGRNSPQYAAVWTGAFPDPHWASRDDRLRPGDLPFLEVPVTTDPAQRWPNGFPYELRIESGPFSYHRRIVDTFLRRITDNAVEFPCVCLFTHNYFEYDNPEADQSRTLVSLAEHLLLLGRDREVVATTLPRIRQQYIEALGEPER